MLRCHTSHKMMEQDTPSLSSCTSSPSWVHAQGSPESLKTPPRRKAVKTDGIDVQEFIKRLFFFNYYLFFCLIYMLQ